MATVMAVKQFGTYRIIRKIGRSMTDVYLALDSRERRVILKIVEHSQDPLTQSVLEAERRGALIQQQLHARDPRIPEVYEQGEQDNCYFVAMEYCEGRNLFEILRMETRLEPLRAARYAAEVCSQLHTLHSFQAEIDGRKRAIVHGDVKPANILIGANNDARLLDFGIAKTITLTRNLTRHDLGSPAYCSPERLKSAQVDPRADLWSLGVTLYELVAGLPPYQAQSTRKLENLIQSRRPPRALPADCPPALKAIIARALAPDPGRRYEDAGAFENDLRAFLEKRRTVAESDRLPSWDSNATIERQAPPALPRRDKQKLVHMVEEANRTIWALAAGLIAGLIVLIPPGYLYRFWRESAPLRAAQDYAQKSTADLASDWQLYKGLDQQNAFLHGLSPIGWVKEPLRSRLLSTGESIIDDYRNSSDPAPEHFDWEKAQTSLKDALDLDPSDARTRSRAALCEGYALLARNPGARALGSFEQAARLDRKWPDPHLALARLEAYSFHNVGQTVAELQQAERLGFHAGPRETEEQADAYLYRGEQELRQATQTGARGEDRRWSLRGAEHDFNRANELYEPISGFSNVSRSLEQLHRDESLRRAWEKSLEEARAKKRVAVRSRPVARRGRWR